MNNKTFFSLNRKGDENNHSWVHAAKICVCIILLTATYPSCEDNNPEKTEQEIIDELDGVLLYHSNQYHIVLHDFNGTPKIISSSYGPGFKWSPDGTKFSLILGIEAYKSVLKIFDNKGHSLNDWELNDIDSGQLHALSWSPDNEYIAILRSDQILFVEVATGIISSFSISSTAGYSTLAWCPKNNKIAIAEANKIWMISPFTEHPSGSLLVEAPEEYNIQYMDWNADGTKLVYSGLTTLHELRIVDFDGNNNKVLTYKSGHETITILGASPCWLTNGNQIIYEHLFLEEWKFRTGLFLIDLKGTYNINLNIEGYEPDCF